MKGVRVLIEELETTLRAQDIQNALELLDHNEWGEALELLCTQLYEYDVPISKQHYDQIQMLNEQMNIPVQEWECLMKLVNLYEE